MESINEYLSDIRKNGDLRRTEARKLVERLREIFDEVGHALHDAGVWGDEMEYTLSKERGEYGERTTYTVLRPSLETYHPDPADSEKKEIVVIEVQEVAYNHGYDEEEGRETLHQISGLPLDEKQVMLNVYLNQDLDVLDTKPGLDAWGQVTTLHNEERVVNAAKKALDNPTQYYFLRAKKRNPVGKSSFSANDTWAMARFAQFEQEVPFLPRRLAVEIAEQLPDILGQFAGYVQQLAVETQEARKTAETVSVE